MDLAGLRAHCLAQPGAAGSYPFGPGALVMKVGGKVFAIIGENDQPLTISVKCDPEWALILRDTYDAVQPGYHLNKRHWNTVTLDGTVDDDEVRDWIDASWDAVVDGLPRDVRRGLRDGHE